MSACLSVLYYRLCCLFVLYNIILCYDLNEYSFEHLHLRENTNQILHVGTKELTRLLTDIKKFSDCNDTFLEPGLLAISLIKRLQLLHRQQGTSLYWYT